MKIFMIIDLCGTLVKENTTHAFVGYINLPWMKRFIRYIAMGHLVGFFSAYFYNNLRKKMLAYTLKGISREKLYELAKEYAQKTLIDKGNKFILSEISAHENATICLASASIDPVVSAFAQLINADCFVSSQLAYDSAGICQGYYASDATGVKWRLITEHWKIDPDYIIKAYTDNLEDQDLAKNSNFIHWVKTANL